MKTIFASFRHKIARICCAIAVCTVAAVMSAAQSPAARIAAEVSVSEMVAISGSQHPLANPEYDAGRVPADTRLNGISLHFNRSAAQQADLDSLLAAQQDPKSPQYHQWLTSDEFAARFGMAQADLDKVTSWLEQQGFSVDGVNRSRNAIRFSGTVGQIESAFQTQMHYYDVAGDRHFAPSTAVSVPAAFAAVVSSIGNLSNFRPRAQHTSPRAGFTSGVSGNVYFAPGDIATAYDLTPLYSGGVNGAGQTIAIMGQSYVHLSDIEAFQSSAGLTKKDPTLVLVPGTGNDAAIFSGDEGESDLDLEWSGAMAPGANVVFVYTGSNTTYGVYDSAQYAIDEMLGNIISLSYSNCESDLTAANLATYEALFQQAAAQGQTVMAASGDSGSTACYGETGLNTAQQEAVMVNYPASSAFVTGVGGTEIVSGNSTSSNSTYWSSNGSSDVLTSLKQYIPEVAWNDDSSSGLSASGGGASMLVSRPSWQAGVPGIPSGSSRLVPDIAFYSSPNLPGFLLCTSDTSMWSSSQTGSCGSGFRASASDSSLTVAGGTSFATPIFAGMVAILNQKLNYTTGQGLINPALYTLAANSATYASAFHDVTSGNNDCANAGSSICVNHVTFTAVTGYDEVTGLGSLDLANAAAAWPVNSGASASLIGTSTTVTPANTAPSVNTADVFTISVASNSGSTTPTGTVILKIDGGTDCWGAGASQGCGGTTLAALTLSSNGTVTSSATFASAGTHQLLAQYSGDATHAASTGVGSVVIAGVSSGKGTFALSATNVAVSRGSTGTSTITVTPSGGYTGTVYLTFSTSNDNALQNLCYGFTTTLNNGDGSVAVTGTAATTTQLSLDTNASDCATGAAVKGTGMHAFKTRNATRNALRASTPAPAKSPLPLGAALAGLIIAGVMGRGSRKLRSLACVIALAAVGLAMTACGGASSATVPNPPTGTYTITVTGADSATATNTATTTFTLTIN